MSERTTASLLTRGQARLHSVLMGVSGFMLANAGYLFACPPEASVLPAFYQWMLVLHVVVGTLLLVPLVIFVALHLPRVIRMPNRVAIVSGAVTTLSTLALFVTGLFIFTRANSVANRWSFISHQLLALGAPLAYAMHRFAGRERPPVRRVAIGLASLVIAFGAMVSIHVATRPPRPPEPQAFVPRPPDGVDVWKDSFPEYGVSGAPPESVFFPAATRTVTGKLLPKRLLTNADLPDQAVLAADIKQYGFAVNARLGAETCARCHQDTVEQWATSAHRFASFNNPFYRVSVEALRKEDDGRRRSQWCGGCHDPAIMMAGNMPEDIKPEIPESQAGLTCLACHAMDEVHGVGGNGGYRIADATPEPYLFADAKGGVLGEVHDLLVRSRPDVHKRDLLKPVFRTSEYCGTCHKVSLDVGVNRYRWLRGQNEYDAHQDSGVARNNARTFYLPPEARRCQDCHMPLVDAPLGDLAAKNGKIRSHRFPGPNTALPAVRGDAETLRMIEEFRRNSLRVDLFAVRFLDRPGEPVEIAPDLAPLALRAGEHIEVQVVVRNKGVGHTFPGGTLDSNEAWVHLRASTADGQAFFESGGVDASTHLVDPTAHYYRAVFVDEHSVEADRRNPQAFRAAVHLKTIGPGTADLVRYRFAVPEGEGNIHLEAAVRWRKFRPAYVAFTWKTLFPERAVPDLPITDVARASADLRVAPAADPVREISAGLATDWVRVNDWGIGLLLQGDTIGASAAFRRLTEIRPELPDGWSNLARTALQDGNVGTALDALGQAEKRAPGNAQLAYFFGLAREKGGQLEDAIAAFEKAREAFPGDRTIHQELGQIRYRLGRYPEALRDYLRVLAIDPEDRAAHYGRFQVYQALGDRHAAGEAERAYRKYQIDESAQKWTREFRLSRPDVNLESQLVHTHGAGAP